MFDGFVGLALKGLNGLIDVLFCSIWNSILEQLCLIIKTVILISDFKSVIMLTGRKNCCDDLIVFRIASVSGHAHLVYFEV